VTAAVKMVMAFKVVSVSSNRNSFGLAGMILVARSGEAWQVGASHLNVKKKGDVVRVPVESPGQRDWAALGFEIPERLKQDAPDGVIKEIWGKEEEPCPKKSKSR